MLKNALENQSILENGSLNAPSVGGELNISEDKIVGIIRAVYKEFNEKKTQNGIYTLQAYLTVKKTTQKLSTKIVLRI